MKEEQELEAQLDVIEAKRERAEEGMSDGWEPVDDGEYAW